MITVQENVIEFPIISPKTVKELLGAISENQNNHFRFGAGYTDLMIELKKQMDPELIVINLAQLKDMRFTTIRKTEDSIRIGALTTCRQMMDDDEIQRNFPALFKSARTLASPQIRQVATIGGNLCTASPAGDLSCALMALGAECEILATDDSLRTISIERFFQDVRKTDLRKNEILQSVVIPLSQSKKCYSDFIKIGVRRSMECSVVSLAYCIQTDEDDRIVNAGVAIGSVAPTIKFAQSACQYLAGRKFNSIDSSEAETFAKKVLEYASPISDIRATAWYRKEVLFNISKSLFESD